MAIDSNILLQGRVAPVGNMLLQGYEAGSRFRQQRDEQPLRNQLLQSEVADAKQRQQAGQRQILADEQRSLITGAAELKPLLDAGDVPGATRALQARRANLQRLGLNTIDTDEALQMLNNGNAAGLKSSVDALYNAGLRSGVLREPDTGRDYYRRRSLELQEQRLNDAARDRNADRALQQSNQAALNDIRQQQVDIQRQASQARETEAQTRQAAATEKKRIANTGLEQELIGLEGVLADVNRAEELLKSNGNLTGPIVGKTPNLSAEAQELESLTQALGIGALQQFKGATSEKELAAALRSGLSMTSDAAPNLKRLAAQRAVIQRNIDRIRGLTGNQAPSTPANQPGEHTSSSGIKFTVE